METTSRPTSHLFGRRKGRPLHKRKAQLVEELLPKLRIVLPEKGPLFLQEGRTVLEIGFGGGEHLTAQAKLRPETNFIGCEPFLNGVASLLDHLDREKISNVRIFDNDARLLLDALKDASLDKAFVLFADPWPKKRHAERRFIGPENLDRLARVLKPQGILRVASDHVSLVEWMRACLETHPAFRCVYASATRPCDWVPTRYEEKALQAGRPPFYMDYVRV